jgi:HK97 gp10 family phage protein
MAKNSTSLQMKGTAELHAVLAALPKEVRQEVLASALGKGAGEVAKRARVLAAKDSGALKRSITYVVRSYRSGETAVAVIGPNKRFRGPDGARPANYAHLVEYGHRVAKGGALTRLDGRGRKGKGVAGGFVPARPFMRPATLAATPVIPGVMLKGVDSGMKRAIAKRVRAGTFKK